MRWAIDGMGKVAGKYEQTRWVESRLTDMVTKTQGGPII